MTETLSQAHELLDLMRKKKRRWNWLAPHASLLTMLEVELPQTVRCLQDRLHNGLAGELSTRE